MTSPIDAAPCRNAGAPLPHVMERVALAINSLAQHPEVLAQYGISAEEYSAALPPTIESIRGRQSADNTSSKAFLKRLLVHLVEEGHAASLEEPGYGKDTVYRLSVNNIGHVAIIQKGCPDGVHSSQTWATPDWADETYLWWLCSSPVMHPGEHIAKGVSRLRRKWTQEPESNLHGIIFHNELCGTSSRPCPKLDAAIDLDGTRIPPPCIYTMPEPQADGETSWNWDGTRTAKFPAVLLKAFDIEARSASMFIGSVGFRERTKTQLNTSITTRYGLGRSSKFRSSR